MSSAVLAGVTQLLYRDTLEHPTLPDQSDCVFWHNLGKEITTGDGLPSGKLPAADETRFFTQCHVDAENPIKIPLGGLRPAPTIVL